MASKPKTATAQIAALDKEFRLMFEEIKNDIASLKVSIAELASELAELKVKEKPWKPLHKVEDFNGEQVPPQKDNTKMNDMDKLASMRNAIKILPPNRQVNGRHDVRDVQAICGFVVTNAMLDAAYGEDK